MTLQVKTARISYNGPDRLDVTRKGNDRLGRYFAPSWPLILRTKRGLSDNNPTAWEEYCHYYLEEMRASYRKHRHAWQELLARKHVVLVCYCVDHTQCHRSLLAEILAKLGAKNLGELRL